MNKKFLSGVLVLLLIVVILGFFILSAFFIVPESSSTFKTMNFDGITVSVPDNSNFVVNTNFHDDEYHGIYIMTYNDVDKKFINRTIDSFILDNNLTEIHIDHVSSDIRTFISEDPNNPSLYAIVVNDNKDKAIFIESSIDQKLAIKIAKTVKF